MSVYLKEPTVEVEAAARALFQRFKDRAAQSIIKPDPGSYALDVWGNLPPSVKGSFYFDAEAALKAVAAAQNSDGSNVSLPIDADEAVRDALMSALAIVSDRAAGGRLLTTKEQAREALNKLRVVLGHPS